MSTLAADLGEAAAHNVSVSDDALAVDLADGRTITAPLTWFPRLGTRDAAGAGEPPPRWRR